MEVLSQYHFTIEHREGKKHLNVDALYHIPAKWSHEDLEPKCQECQSSVDEWQDFKKNIETITDLSKRGKTFSSRAYNLDWPCIWMYQFSITEMIDFQKQDSDLKFLYQWLEQEKLPSRYEVVQFSPAVRNVWLNWDSITLKNGTLNCKLTLADNKDVQRVLVPKNTPTKYSPNVS